ncbi:DNA repair photolyase [Shimia gijangensis]|uniref:DNA repair photolyase n=1 Tax=Shimia gijangensis TaxID=1470563 RepID=A0A1M6RF86_9RHOB|nr:PA0069 family radical SAM protein [Shimia gijangensis]SHK31134.1 DNA repair photolyase [Shimia gijangensis]
MTEQRAYSIDSKRRRGRGALSNATGRFDLDRIEQSDGWEIEEVRPAFDTQIRLEHAKSMIARNSSPDVPFDRSINPYRGCEHGCIYCFARPTHAYLGMSPGLDFETQIIARPNAPEILEKELQRKSYRVATLAIGTNTDPYQPAERDHGIMRACLEILRDFSHPVGIVTKGTLIERDIDLLGDMAARNLVHVGVSVTTLDPHLSRLMEPRVPSPARRLATIRRLSDAGVPVRVMMAPVVPSITDHEIEAVLKAGKDAGAISASWIMLRLPLEVSDMFKEWLEEHFPERASRVMARVREMHGGRDYDAAWGRRMRGEGHYASMISARFKMAQRRLALAPELPELAYDLFCSPIRKGEQMSLF